MRGIGKSIKNNELIELYDGNNKKVIDIKQGDIVLSFDHRGYAQKGVVTELFTSKPKEFLKITLESGKVIECAVTHNLLTDNGWVPSAELKVGGYLATSRTGIFGTETRNMDEIRLYALALGDGCLTRSENNFVIGSIYKEYQNEYRRIANSLGCAYTEREDNSVSSDRVRSAPIIYFEFKYGLNEQFKLDQIKVKAQEKFIPDWIKMLDKEHLAEFLKYLYATDGGFHFDGKKLSIQYTSTSRKLAYDVEFLLRKFGIVARIQKTVSARRGVVFGDMYNVYVKEKNHVKKFLSEIGIFAERHKKAVEKAKEHLGRKNISGGQDVIPVSITSRLFGDVACSTKDGTSDMKKRLKNIDGRDSDSAVQREYLQRFCSLRKNKELHDIAHNDIFWDRIESIESTGIDIGYDFEVSQNHNYVANGIISHNSYGMRSAFVTLCLKYSIEAVIVRKTYVDVEQNHIIPIRAELSDFFENKLIKINLSEKSLFFPSTGSRLLFTYCDGDKDLDRFQGRAYDLMGIEESGQFTEFQLAVMQAANRTSPTAIGKKSNFPPKCLFTFNWGGPGHRYLKRIAHDKVYLPEKGENPDMFKCIIGKYDENKIFQAQDPTYQERLKKLPLQLQRAWIDGDPDAFSGTVFNIVDMAHEVNPHKLLQPYNGVIPPNWQLFGALDPGTASPCSFGLYAKTPQGEMFKIFNYYEKDRNPKQHALAIRDAIFTDRFTNGRYPSYILAGADAFHAKNKRDIRAHDTTWKDVFRDVGLHLVRADVSGGSRVRGFQALNMFLHYEYSSASNTFTQLPKLRFFADRCKPTLDELKQLESDPNNPEDIRQGTDVDDHAYDETRYAIMGATKGYEIEEDTQRPPENKSYDYERLRQPYSESNSDASYDWEDVF
jgi:intein/homing endonuclease